jgi:hypothetical protein
LLHSEVVSFSQLKLLMCTHAHVTEVVCISCIICYRCAGVCVLTSNRKHTPVAEVVFVLVSEHFLPLLSPPPYVTLYAAGAAHSYDRDACSLYEL